MKEMEGDRVDAVVDDAALKGYGPFFRSARYLVNCSFGEPLLHPRLAEILNACAERKKIIELSTNGQAFTDRTIKALVGKPVNLYVSLDAATRETYAKIRNDRWDDIVPSLVRLNEERQKAGRLPRIYLVFIPMRVNAGDLEEYFRLAQRIEADKLVLRPLLSPGQAEGADRSGRVPLRLRPGAAGPQGAGSALPGRRSDLPGNTASPWPANSTSASRRPRRPGRRPPHERGKRTPGLPLCREPWENFYILRRGILPCCYGGAVIGAMEDYAEVWNSPEIQEIRRVPQPGQAGALLPGEPGLPHRPAGPGPRRTRPGGPSAGPRTNRRPRRVLAAPFGPDHRPLAPGRPMRRR